VWSRVRSLHNLMRNQCHFREHSFISPSVFFTPALVYLQIYKYFYTPAVCRLCSIISFFTLHLAGSFFLFLFFSTPIASPLLFQTHIRCCVYFLLSYPLVFPQQRGAALSDMQHSVHTRTHTLIFPTSIRSFCTSRVFGEISFVKDSAPLLLP